MKKMLAGLLFCSSFALMAKTPHELCIDAGSCSSFLSGDGSASDPFLVCNKEQLRRLSQDPSLSTMSFKVGADIDFSNYPYYPIGSSAIPFQGVFDGDGYTFTNITLVSPQANRSKMGLFGYVKNGQIKNLSVNGLKIAQFATQLGGIAGQAENANFMNLHVTQLNLKVGDQSGGLVGMALKSNISNASVEGTMEISPGADATGGLVGYTELCDISSSGSNVKMFSRESSPFGVSDVGGLVGLFIGGHIKDVYAWGDIDFSQATSTSGPNYLGGIVGRTANSFLANGYFSGRILSASSTKGGVIYLMNNCMTNNLYWDSQVSGLTQSAAGVGKQTSELKQSAFWLNTGFSSGIWALKDGQYPRLLSDG